MKANAPEKIYVYKRLYLVLKANEHNITKNIIEYIRIDVFIEKAKSWFERQNEWFDPDGNRHCDMESFEDFKKYMKGE